ncbi:hypothetical protein AGMMS50218_09720 [Actinomycetota bacterium]|nr:hypothetical protein AGMMS50218_09720 [Actinomycetota bacterium]
MTASVIVHRRTAVLTVVALVASGAVAGLSTSASAADPCAPGGNPIVCENSKPGAPPSEWDIEGAGDEGIQGFATDISVNVGGTIGFKIDTDARAYTIDIYRTGWYGGDGARKIASVTPSATLPQHQPECYSDATTELYDCGNWAVSASWTVPTAAVSGVYIARLHDPATDDESHITFVVRNDASHSKITFQTSDPTWHAYNPYGGSDFYQGAANGRAYKISYNRPFATRDDIKARDFYFGSEYPMVRFLERNGYDVSYQSGVDTARYGSLLTNHQVFLSVGHDEYWSGAQRANVEAARDAGVNLAFFSGNEVYWRTRYEKSVAGTPTDYRTLVSYKETWSDDKIDPSPEWTGTWRDPRFAGTDQGAGRPENGLTGTLYMSNNSDLPVTVSAAEGKLRLWRGTTLTSLATGTTAALAPHTVGYESDEDLDNGSRPPGLIRLSTTVGAVPQYLQDFGNVVAEGTTTHHVTLYRAASGALVFSAGSIQWSWGLDATHDGDGAPADPRMQQATVNLLADMGAQPATLMSGLVAASASTDTVGPTVTIGAPASGATVANGTTVTASGTAVDSGGGRVAGVEVSTDNGATWHPASGTSAWSYTYVQPGQGSAVPLKVRAVDDSARIGAVATRTLKVSCPCTLFGTSTPPVASAEDTSAVELGLRFHTTVDGYVSGVRFYKGAANTGTHTGSLWDTDGNRLTTVTFSGESATGWQTAQFAQPVPVTAGRELVVSYTAPAGGYATATDAFSTVGRTADPIVVDGGYASAPAGVFGPPGTYPEKTFSNTAYYVDPVFTTVDGTPLTLSGQSPAAGATSVPVGTTVSVVLSKPVVASTVAVSLAVQGGASVPGAVAYDATTRTARFTPAAALAPATVYRATVSATDSTGAGVSGASSWTFTTAAPPQQPGGATVSLYDDSDVPGVLEVADPDAVTLGTRFASAVDGTVTAVRFYKGPGNTGTHVGELWAVDGSARLAQATFTNESASGWQTVTFDHPVAITRDTEYVAAYRTTVGRYSATVGAFSGAGVQRAPLRTDSTSGAYSYANGYPGASTSTSYLVDVVFKPTTQPLTVVTRTPAADEPGVAVDGAVSIELNQPLADGAALALTTQGQAVAGASALSADRRTVTFTPAAALPTAQVVTVTASGLVAQSGTSLANVTWSFTTAAPAGCPCTLFGSETPDIASANDPDAVELGVAFTTSEPGLATGVRFYKGAGNTGTHTGSLWSSSGQRLRTVTFTGETASGWQTATFSQPYELEPGESYVVSYLAPDGGYAATSWYFDADHTNGPLTAPAVGNGRYKYGGGYPAESWQETSYLVDVVFERAAPSAPSVSSTTPLSGATAVSPSAVVAATLSKAPTSGSPTLAVSGPDGAVAGTSAYDAASRVVTFTPAAPLPAGVALTATVTLGGATPSGGSWGFTTASASAPAAESLWTDLELPTVAAWDDPDAVQVGTRFTADVAGTVTAIRFYKGASNTGTHTVTLWDAAGHQVATAPSTAESASGWQTVALAAPVAVQAGAVYTAAYHSTTGRYAVTAGGLAQPRVRSHLTTSAPGGAYVYGTGFPGSGSTAWYGVDLVFLPAG